MSYYTEQLENFFSEQPSAVKEKFDTLIRSDLVARNTYFAEHVGALVDTLPTTTFWKHQKEAIQNTHNHFAQADSEGIAITVMPAGSGKTNTFQAITDSLGEDVTGSLRVTPRIILLEPTNQLVDQTYTRYKGNAESKGLYPNLMIGRASGDITDIQPFTVMTYDTFIDWMKDGRITADDFDYLVMDEAHRGLSDARQEEFAKLKGKVGMLLYTATPSFDAEKNVYELFGKQNEVINVPIQRLINEQVLPPQTNIMLEVCINGKLPSDRAERRKLFSEAATEAAYSLYSEYKDPHSGQPLLGKPFLAYTRDIAHARQWRTYFSDKIRQGLETNPTLFGERSYDHIAEAISGKESDRLQDAILRRFSTRKTLGLANAEILREGADFPEVNVTFGMPTSSRVKEIQIHGRGNRINPALDPDDPAQRAYSVDLFFRVNGKLTGERVFYHQLVDAAELGQLITVDMDVDTEVGVEAAGREMIDQAGGRQRKPARVKVSGPLRISSSVEDVRRIDAEMAGTNYPLVMPGMLTASKMSDKASILDADASAIFGALKQKWLDAKPIYDAMEECYLPSNAETDPLVVKYNDREYSVPINRCGMYQSGSDSAFFVHETQFTQFRKAPKKPLQMLIYAHMGAEAGISDSVVESAYRKLRLLWEEAMPLYDDTDNCYKATVPGKEMLILNDDGKHYDIPVTDCGVFKSGTKYPFCVDKKYAQKFSRAPGFPVGSNMLIYSDMAREAETHAQQMKLIYKQLEARWRETEPVYDEEQRRYVAIAEGYEDCKELAIVVAGTERRIPYQKCGLFRGSGNNSTFYVDASESEKLARAPKHIDSKMLMQKEMIKPAAMSPKDMGNVYKLIEAAWLAARPEYDYAEKRYFSLTGEDTFKVKAGAETFDMSMRAAGYFRRSGPPPFHVDESQAPTTIRAMAAALRKVTQRKPDAPVGMKSGKTMHPLTKLGPAENNAAYALISEAWCAASPVFDTENGRYKSTVAGKDPLTVRVGETEISIPISGAGEFKVGNSYPFMVHSDYIDAVRRLGIAIRQQEHTAKRTEQTLVTQMDAAEVPKNSVDPQVVEGRRLQSNVRQTKRE